MQTMQTSTIEMIYPLPHSTAEIDRLIAQSALLNPITRALFVQAGIAPGMRVLDLGSGAGDVALLAAEMVGPTGEVVGVDRNPGVLDVARARAEAAGFAHLTFRAGGIESAIPPGETFDAVVGRLILMYLPEPAATLHDLAARLRPGGIVAFCEFNLTPESMRTYPPVPLFDRCCAWLQEAFQHAGAETRMGDKLYQTYRAADLPGPQLHFAANASGEPDWGGYTIYAEVLRTLLPLIVKSGIATAAEVDIDTLEDRMRAEVVAHGGILKMPDLVSAWARVA
jgi:ubiquinone/menaquinone biosynthesis C-methylase UbiE